LWLGPENYKCPNRCCPPTDYACSLQMGNYGYTVPVDEEFMLIFGGITARSIDFKD